MLDDELCCRCVSRGGRERSNRLGDALRAASAAGVSPLEVGGSGFWLWPSRASFRSFVAGGWICSAIRANDAPVIARAYFSWCMRRTISTRRVVRWNCGNADYPTSSEPLKLLGITTVRCCIGMVRKRRIARPTRSLRRMSNVAWLWPMCSPRDSSPPKRFLCIGGCSRPGLIPSAASRGLGACSASTGNVAEGLSLLKGALERNPDDFETLREYGEMLLTEGKAMEAVPPLKKAYDQVPEHAIWPTRWPAL